MARIERTGINEKDKERRRIGNRRRVMESRQVENRLEGHRRVEGKAMNEMKRGRVWQG